MKKTKVKTNKKTMKKTVATKRSRTVARKWPLLQNKLIKRVLMGIGIVIFAFVGMHFLKYPFALNPDGVPSGGDEIVAQFEHAHSHDFIPDSIMPFHPAEMTLFGDGLLLCGEDSPSPKKGYELTSAKLTAAQIDDFMKQVNAYNPDSDVEVAHNQSTTASFPIQTLDQITINYNKGAAALFGNYDSHTAAFSSIEKIIHATCQKYAKAKYDPEKYIVLAAPVSEDTVKDYDEVDASLAPTTTEETNFRAVIGRDEAKAISNMNNGNNFAKFHKDGKAYAMQLIPVVPDFKTPVISSPKDKNKVEAASYLPTKWYWIYPSDKTLSSLSSEAASVSSHARAFLKQETGRDNSAAAVVNIHLKNTTSYYQNTCPAGVNCADTSSVYNTNKSSYKDARAWANIKNELVSSNVVPDGTTAEPIAASYNFLYQGPSGYGAGRCSGYAGIGGAGSVTNSRGAVGITFGYGSTASGACQMTNYPAMHYWAPTHEMGHTLGLQHPSMTCATSGATTTNLIMTGCGALINSSWPGSWTFGSTNNTSLKASSLFVNHLIYGRVVYAGTSTGVPNIKITSCNTLDPDTVTNSSGNFAFRFPTRAGYCLRMTAPTGYKISTQNNPEHSTATTYESNLAGYNCYKQPVSTSCNSNQVTWDMASDLSKNFILTKTP